MGNFFRNKLGYEWQNIYKTGYLWPPVGGFFTHESETASTAKTPVILADHFDHRWAQEGTRKLLPKQEHRWVCDSGDRIRTSGDRIRTFDLL